MIHTRHLKKSNIKNIKYYLQEYHIKQKNLINRIIIRNRKTKDIIVKHFFIIFFI